MKTTVKVVVALIGLIAGIAEILQYYDSKSNAKPIDVPAQKASVLAPQGQPQQRSVIPPGSSTNQVTIENKINVAPTDRVETQSPPPAPVTAAPPQAAISPAAAWALERSLQAAQEAGDAARVARHALRQYGYWRVRDNASAVAAYAQLYQAYNNARNAGYNLYTRYNEVAASDWSAVDGHRLQACGSDLVTAGYRAAGARQVRENIQATTGQVNLQALDLELSGYEDLAVAYSKCMSFAKRSTP